MGESAHDPLHGRLLVSVFLIMLPSLLVGFDFATTPVVRLTLKHHFHLDSFHDALLTIASPAGGALAGFAVLQFPGRVGRRAGMALGCALCVVGSVVSATSSSLAAFLCGKGVVGAGSAIVLLTMSVFLTEISPKDIRGRVLAAASVVIVVGMGLGNATRLLFATGDGWRSVCICNLVLGVVVALPLCFVPESARWLVLRDYVATASVSEEATLAMMDVFGSRSSDAVEKDIRHVVHSIDTMQRGAVREILSVSVQMRVTVLVSVLHQLVGWYSSWYYTDVLIRGALGDATHETGVAFCLINLAQLFATLVGASVIDSAGRNVLLSTSTLLMAFSNTAVAFLVSKYALEANVFTITAFTASIVFYQVGVATTAWLLFSELFPIAVRSRAVGMAATVDFSCLVGVALVSPLCHHHLGVSATFGLYAGLCVLWTGLVVAWVPETMGLSIESVEQLFEPRKRRRAP